IQWSSHLVYQDNPFQENVWSGHQVTGPPDAFPPGVLHKSAFRLRSRSDIGRFIVGFDQPQQATHVVIVESFLPGRVAQVKLIDDKGNFYVIYQSIAYASTDNFRTLVLGFPKTPYLVKEVEITLSTVAAPGNSQIDAVGISDHEDIAGIRKELRGANFNIHHQLTFVSVKEKLNENINSRYTETKPLVSHDGRTLFFSRMFYPGNFGGKEDPQDIYFSTAENDHWQVAKNIGSPLNDLEPNGVCSISPDGKNMLVINAYQPNGSITPGVSISRLTSTGWSKPEQILIDDFYNTSEFQDFYLSANGDVMLMALERRGGYGDQDLYLSFKKGYNHFSKPVNMGRTINTTGAEFAPFLSADGTTLYFSSDGHGGYGKSDIFFSYRLDSSWLSWTTPRNIGPAINTSSWDAYFSITSDGRYAYFVSSEGDRREAESIYRISLLKDMHEEPEKLELSFSGNVYDAQTRIPIQAVIELSPDALGRVSELHCDETTGYFSTKLTQNGLYRFSMQAPGYVGFDDTFMADLYSQQDIRREVFLQPISPGQVINIDNLQFEQGKPTILEVSLPIVDKLLHVLRSNPSMVIELAGHTDRLGSKDANFKLSLDRVENVKQYLVEGGIEPWRVRTIGHGGSRPIAPSDNEDNRALNRRVEITVMRIGEAR
ncbi:MAG: OmpA family protein, partial [Cyclobacteriaceae bacterium]